MLPDGVPNETEGATLNAGSAAAPARARGPDAGEPPTLAPGALLAGRFRLVRFIGRGGMGEVYEAEDAELGDRVALKTLRPEIAQDQKSLDRFKREILLARKVTHPNVCRVFDIFHHRGETDVAFLTMELLPGETLAEHLRRSGAMATTEALPLAQQMAAALDAAHRAGVIHRDFKTANVMLVPAAEGQTGVRAVVTDFGLARPSGAGAAAGVSLTTAFVGTPTYMAPEQVRGGEVTAAADVYSFGIVLYEVVTGHVPFAGDSPMAVAIRRLEEPPPSPRKFAPELDPTWDQVILRCLDRDPKGRCATASDAVALLTSGEATAESKPQRWRIAVAVIPAALLIGGATYHFYTARTAPPPTAPTVEQAAKPQPPPVKLRPAVAVIGFKNLSGRADAAWLSTALAEMLGTELAAGEKVRMVAGENVARMKRELALTDADSLARDTLARIRNNVGADLVVLGSYTVLGQGGGAQIRLDLRVQDVRAGETTASVAETSAESKLFELAERTGARLREKMGFGSLTAEQAGGLRAAQPASSAAARAYADGLTRLRVFDALGARQFFDKAVAADPRSALAHSMLAAAWAQMGYDSRAAQSAKKAVELSAALVREERLSIEGRAHEVARAWPKAIDVYRALWGFFPDNLEYGLRLAAAQTGGAKAKDALATIDSLRKLPAPLSADPRIDLAEAAAAAALSDSKRQQAAAARAARTATSSGAQFLVAQARLMEGFAFAGMSDYRKAVAAYDEARRIYEAADDPHGVARAQNSTAIALRLEGRLVEARAAGERALATFRKMGTRAGEASAVNNIAAILNSQGELEGARRRFEEALATYREVGNRGGEANALNNIAVVLKSQGNMPEARTMYERALATYKEIGHRAGEASSRNNIAIVMGYQGDLVAARKMYEQALDLYRQIDNKSGVANVSYGLGRVLAASGDLDAARRRLEESRAMSTALGEGAGVTDVARAIVELEQGRPAEAEKIARQVAEEFRKQKAADDEALALAVLARAQLAQGRAADARQTMDQAAHLRARSRNPFVRVTLAIAAARVNADIAAALREVNAAFAEARKAGMVSLQLETRLALGELELKSANIAAGRARLAALEKEASSRGFGLIARNAAAALRAR